MAPSTFARIFLRLYLEAHCIRIVCLDTTRVRARVKFILECGSEDFNSPQIIPSKLGFCKDVKIYDLNAAAAADYSIGTIVRSNWAISWTK